MKKIVYLPLLVCLLTACDQQATNTAATPSEQPTTVSATESSHGSNPHDLEALAKTLPDDGTAEAKPITTADGKIQIDWSFIDTKTNRADTANYAYPIAIDSNAVKNYAKAYNISDKAAQHSIVVSMAVPEALGKLLDQLENHYRSHELTDGADMKLIIHTTHEVVADTHEYVFADKFGEGLVLPIEIRPAGK